MKSNFFLLSVFFLFALICTTAYGQRSSSVTFHAGYAGGLSATHPVYILTDDIGKVKFYSYGSGISAGLSYVFMFNNNFGFEAGASYLFGNSIEETDEDNVYSEKASMLRIAPCAILKAQLGNVSPYARVGLVMNTGSIKSSVKDKNDPDDYLVESSFHGGVSFGVRSSLGAVFQLDAIAIFVEADALGLAYSPKRFKLTKVIFDGEDWLDEFDVNEKEAIFVSELDPSFNPSPDEPDKVLRDNYPFSSIGLNVGISLPLGGKK